MYTKCACILYVVLIVHIVYNVIDYKIYNERSAYIEHNLYSVYDVWTVYKFFLCAMYVVWGLNVHIANIVHFATIVSYAKQLQNTAHTKQLGQVDSKLQSASFPYPYKS